MEYMSSEIRNILVGAIFLLLLAAFVWSIYYGRKYLRNERTDAVYGNPVKALGGWWWIITGVSTILLFWFYFSWDAARAFFPNAANEMCQVAKVNTALNPVRTVFPMQSRLLRGTSFLSRDMTQIDEFESRLARYDVTEEAKNNLIGLNSELRTLLASRAAPESVSPEINSQISDVAATIKSITAKMKDPNFPGAATDADKKAAETAGKWGDAVKEIPGTPISDRGRKFDKLAKELTEVAKVFGKIRNLDDSFKAEVKALNTRIDVYRKGSDPSEAALGKQLNKILKRIDDGSVFPPAALDPIENSLLDFNAAQSNAKGSLKLLDAIAMPGGTIVAGATACTEQGSGRWLPKPSDTLATLVRLSDPNIGYKSNPLLWYKMKPVSEMAAFFIPDWIADFIPGEYPRHGVDGNTNLNLKAKVLSVATGNYPSLSLPIPTGHLWDSVMRVLAGLFMGILLGVPLGLFMGLSRFAKGFFDPLIELYRPVPPLAWAPLILTIFGINDDGKIFLLFMVAFAIMVISARTGATGTQLSEDTRSALPRCKQSTNIATCNPAKFVTRKY